MPTPEERLREKERMERIAEKKRKRLEPEPAPESVLSVSKVVYTTPAKVPMQQTVKYVSPRAISRRPIGRKT